VPSRGAVAIGSHLANSGLAMIISPVTSSCDDEVHRRPWQGGERKGRVNRPWPQRRQVVPSRRAGTGVNGKAAPDLK
jgi:hypothetical protein